MGQSEQNQYNEAVTESLLHNLDGAVIIHDNGDTEWWVNGERLSPNGRHKLPNGTVVHFKDSKLHRDDGPALYTRNFARQEWWVNGQRHRIDYPAIEEESGSCEYWHEGKRHRANNLAAVIVDIGQLEYWVNGQRHREDGPAVIYPTGACEYWLNGQKHRPAPDPAVYNMDGRVEFWENGALLRKDFFAHFNVHSTDEEIEQDNCNISVGR